MVTVACQITFRAEMHVNDFFLFLKKLFLTSAHQNDSKYINLNFRKKFKFFKNTVSYTLFDGKK